VAKNPKQFRQWRARRNRLLGRPKPLEGKLLNYPVQVMETLEGWAWGGGWIDGPAPYSKGCILFLRNAHDGLIHFDLGACPLPWSICSGWMHEEDLGKVRRLTSDQIRKARRREPLD
jgi:hypothetical protein